MTKVTVAICTYNRCDYLKESIDSVRRQSYKDIKIIVYDNASTDNTSSVVQQAMLEDCRIAYVRQDNNIGAVNNFNLAMDSCNTKYLVIFHDDDIMLPHMLEEELHAMESNKEAIICGQSMGITSIDGNGAVKEITTLYKRKKGDTKFSGQIIRYDKEELIKFNIELCVCSLICPTVMMNMELIDQVGLRFKKDRGIAIDWILWMDANRYGQVIGIEKDMIRYRVHADSDTQSSSAERWIDAHLNVRNWLMENGYRDKLDKFIEHFQSIEINHYIDSCILEWMNSSGQISIKSRMEDGAAKYGWDDCYKDNLSKKCLKQIAELIGNRHAELDDYFQLRKRLRDEFGRTGSFFEEINWLRKYYLKRRLFNMGRKR